MINNIDIADVVGYNDLMDNVIEFPTRKKQDTEPTLETVALNLSMVKMNHINDTLSTILPILFNSISIAGFDVVPSEDDEEPINIKESALIVEAVRSILCKHYDIEHPLQEVADAFFIEKDDGSITISDHLDINLEKYEKGIAD